MTTTEKLTDYNIVIAKSPEALTKAVQMTILAGWRPQGGPLLVSSTQGMVLMQALVKFEAPSALVKPS